MISNKKGQLSDGILILLLMAALVSMLYYSRKTTKENKTQLITIAQVIASEGCGEGKIGMYLIANTIKNRSEKWDKSPYEIVTQPNQYFGLTSPNRIQLYNQCKDFSDELTSKILELPDITDGALYFRQPTEEKRSWHKTETLRYKNHIFYK